MVFKGPPESGDGAGAPQTALYLQSTAPQGHTEAKLGHQLPLPQTFPQGLCG